MKAKSILLPAIAIAIFAAPAIAQVNDDYHDYTESVREATTQTVQETAKETASQKQYLDIGYLKAYMYEDFEELTEQKRLTLLEQATNSIQDKKITDKDQYELMAMAIETNHNEILEILLQAGFDAQIDVKLNQNLNESQKEFIPLSEKAKAVNNTKALKLLAKYISAKEEGYIGVYYTTPNGTQVIKKFDKPLNEAEYQEWLRNNETMMRTTRMVLPPSNTPKKLIDHELPYELRIHGEQMVNTREKALKYLEEINSHAKH